MKNSIKTLAIWLIIGIIFIVLISSILENGDRKLSYSELVTKIEANEVDYYNHTWVEIESENLVADYNHNIIMNRDTYYKLFGAKKISKTSTAEMEDVIKTVIIGTGIHFHPIYIDYLGKEMKNDLMKNKKILKKEINY